MNRRFFFANLAAAIVPIAAPGLFLPKLIKPSWKPLPRQIQALDMPFSARDFAGAWKFHTVRSVGYGLYKAEFVSILAPDNPMWEWTPETK